MVDKTKSSIEENKNTDIESVPDNNFQSAPEQALTDEVPSSDVEKKEGSGAVSYVSDGQTPQTDEAEGDDSDDDLSDEEYEKIKKELLDEYIADEENEFKDEDGASQTLENTGIEDKAVTPDLINNQVSSVATQSSQDEINSIMGNNQASNDSDSDVEDVKTKLDNNTIDNDHSFDENIDSLTPDVDKGISRVALSKGSSVFILTFVVICLLYIIYKMLQPDHTTDVKVDGEIDVNQPIVKPIKDVGKTIVVPEIPKFPDAPKQIVAPMPQSMPTPPLPPLLDVTPVAPPPPPTIATAPAGLTPPPINAGSSAFGQVTTQDLGDLDEKASQQKAQDDARKKARLKSGIMVAGGGGGKKTASSQQAETLTKLTRNTDQIAATYIGDLHRIIAQGKVIDAVLETAINTDLPGQIRAVVARDVYSEAGKNILINRGSRLIGTYSADVKYGQARVQILWERIIRPDGIDIKVASSGVDDIGRAGMPGDVDNHVLHNIATALMMSAINVTLAEFADNQSGTTGGTTTSTSTTDATSGTTSSSSTSNTLNNEQQAYQDSLNTINKVTNDMLAKGLNMPPTITVDQGTTLKVFVKKDIIFPGPSANLTRMID